MSDNIEKRFEPDIHIQTRTNFSEDYTSFNHNNTKLYYHYKNNTLYLYVYIIIIIKTALFT